MTTIAYDVENGEIAADSQDTDTHFGKYHCRKLYEIHDHIIATAGGSYSGLAFVRWFDEHVSAPDTAGADFSTDQVPDYVNLDVEEDFECLVIRPDRTCYTVNRLFVPYEQEDNPFICLGSGGPIARGAMMAGASARDAVDIAKQIDALTGGPIRSLTV